MIAAELQRRRNMWAAIVENGGPHGVSPSLLRQLRVYGGAQGIWVDKSRTGNLTEEGTGITVSVLHTGTSYADDIADDVILYHYPNTNRGGRDQTEIDATKAATRLGIPIFVIAYQSSAPSKRDVYLGWVESWDDDFRLFLISFGDGQPPLLVTGVEDSEPFVLTDSQKSRTREVSVRQGQQRFRFRVSQRYGPRCAVCDLDIPELLDAAHIRPINERGSYDPRNGLVLCSLHHRAFDARLFAIEPDDLTIRYRSSGPHANELKISRQSLQHLSRKPHEEALDWLWKLCQRKYGYR